MDRDDRGVAPADAGRFRLGAGAPDGSAGREIDEARDPEMFVRFRDGLTEFMQELAQLVVRDGEGATKFVTISVDVCLSLCNESAEFYICTRAL